MNDPGHDERQQCIYCGLHEYEPGWGCHFCGTTTVEDVQASRAKASPGQYGNIIKRAEGEPDPLVKEPKK